MSDIERVEIIKKSMCYASGNWYSWSEQTKIEFSREVVQQYKQLKEEYWKDYAWKSMTFYQRILAYVIESMKN